MRILVIALLCTLSLSAQAQNERQFSIGANFSPNYSYRQLKSEQYQSFVDVRNERETPVFGFNTGISADYSLIKRLELEIGIQYSRQAYMMKDLPLMSIDGPVGSTDLEYRFEHLEIPIRANFRFIEKKFFVYATAGASVQLLLNSKSLAWLSYDTGESAFQKSDEDIPNTNNTTFALVAGLGIGYPLHDRLNLRLEPVFRYALKPLSDSPIKQYNYSFGAQVGLNFRF